MPIIASAATAGLILLAMLSIGPVGSTMANGEVRSGRLPQPPQNGTMGFVIDSFVPPIVPGMDACSSGVSPKIRDAYLQSRTPAERARLSLKENEEELARLWKAETVGPDGTNICSQPEMFDRPLLKTVQSSTAWGLDLDQGNSADTCNHEEFSSPAGDPGVDNQEYRALGCKPEWRGNDGNGGDQLVGTRQFMASGE